MLDIVFIMFKISSKKYWLVAWFTFRIFRLREFSYGIYFNTMFLTIFGSNSEKIKPFWAISVVLHLFVCFMNFFGLCPLSEFFVLLCIFLVWASDSRRNLKKRIHAISDTLRSRGDRVTRTEKNKQNIEVTRKLKSFYRANHYKLWVFKWLIGCF